MKRNHFLNLRLFLESMIVVLIALVFAAHNPVDVAMPIYTFALCVMMGRCTGVVIREIEKQVDDKI